MNLHFVFHRFNLLIYLEYRIRLITEGCGKNSSARYFYSATFTDTVTCTITNEKTNPSEIQVELKTLSGTGSVHEILLQSDNFGPSTLSATFKLNQNFIFSDLYPGDQYTIKVQAFSKGRERLVREYEYSLVAYPDKPEKIKSQTSSTETSLSITVTGNGLWHKIYVM